MTKPRKIVIIRARHDQSFANIPDQACLDMLMTGPRSVLKYWEENSAGYFDFLDSAMMPWVDITIDPKDTSRGTQAQLAFNAVRAREPGRDPLAGFDGALVLVHPGQITIPNPQAGKAGQAKTITLNFDGGSSNVGSFFFSVYQSLASDHTFMCHELGHTLGFQHSYGLNNNGIDYNQNDGVDMLSPEYGSPYDLMSSAAFGSRWLGKGPLYSASPTFTGPSVANWPYAGAAQMGPNLSRANLHLWYPDALATQLVDRPFPGPGEVGRIRLASALSSSGTRLLVLHPPGEPASGVGRIYIEYRTASGWDQGLHSSGADLARVGVVVHTLEDIPNVGPRVWYRGTLATGDIRNNLAVPTGPVVVSLEEYSDAAGNAWADISFRNTATTTKSNLFWENVSDGSLQIWALNGASVAGRATVVSEAGKPEQIGEPWRIVGLGDFNGDGMEDLLWANAADSTMQIWLLNGAQIAGRVTVIAENGSPEHLTPPWRVVGAGDFNGDGKGDILWANASDGSMQVWSMNGGQVAGRNTVVAENGTAEHIGPPWHIVGLGDFNADGKSDILWANSSDRTMQIWIMNGAQVAARLTVTNENGTPAQIGPPWRLVRAGDFNGDGKADFLWSNVSDQTMQIWFMDGARVNGRAAIVAEDGKVVQIGAPWTVTPNGGFNRFVTPEILWHNSSTGEIQTWYLQSYRLKARANILGENGSVALIGPPWSIVGTGDFNLNGTNDIVWHNSSTNETQLWFMDRGRVASRATIVDEAGKPIFVGPPWSIVGTGDFDLNGTADLLWHNSATGEMQIWLMNTYRIANRVSIQGETGATALIGPPWSIVAVADFNVDGGADILWHNSATGEIQIWFMNGFRVALRATVLGETGSPAPIGPPWSIAGSSDFNLNGNADILWHNSATGEVQLWLMNRHQVASRATVVSEVGQPMFIGPPWNIVGA